MSILILVSTIAAAQPAEEPITVTAVRTPAPQAETPASVTSFDEAVLDDLSLPYAPDVLRLTPGLNVSASGPRGTQVQIRIRGAEANQTLIFLDGIRFNDPAAANEARFELLATDSLARIEIVRGPQSALWGSEALGGAIAADSADPFRGAGFEGVAEYGSLDSARASGRYALRAGDVGVAASAGWLSSDGIDSFGAPGGDRDGFDNRSASLRIEARPAGAFRFGVTGHWIEGRNDYDGLDPVFFVRTDTLDTSHARIAAVRGWASARWGNWSASADLSYLDSANRNRLAGAPFNSTFGDRLTFGGQLSYASGGHTLILAAEHQSEDYRARDTAFFGATNQDSGRHSTGIVGEWRAEWRDWIVTDIAVRHDSFSKFADATSWRGSLLLRPTPGLALHAAYGEGIAQPTFTDLFGFFPGSFVGNPALGPETSRGWEAGIAWSDGRFSLGATWFSARLRNEIVPVFDPMTFLSSTANATGTSRRDGLELSAGYRHAGWLNVSANYTWLDADDQQVAGALLVREIRRPRHSFNLIAHGSSGRFRWGASLAWVGSRLDSDFDLFPATTVRLDSYVLVSANVAYRLLPGLEAFARAENAFDADYQDVVGYNTPGRTIHAGLRVTFGH